MSEGKAKPFFDLRQPGKVYIEVSPDVYVEGYLMSYNMEMSMPRMNYRSMDGESFAVAQRSEVTLDVKVVLTSPVEQPLPDGVLRRVRRPSVRGTVMGMGRPGRQSRIAEEPLMPEPVMPEIPERELTAAARRFQALDLEDVEEDDDG